MLFDVFDHQSSLLDDYFVSMPINFPSHKGDFSNGRQLRVTRTDCVTETQSLAIRFSTSATPCKIGHWINSAAHLARRHHHTLTFAEWKIIIIAANSGARAQHIYATMEQLSARWSIGLLKFNWNFHVGWSGRCCGVAPARAYNKNEM